MAIVGFMVTATSGLPDAEQGGPAGRLPSPGATVVGVTWCAAPVTGYVLT